ncbi:MAG: HAD hydrolase-like protein [Promicromonosporaceae bacterium]|nr:HAD hydrolase-like protein [Promicromonosporaceae bacterium]
MSPGTSTGRYELVIFDLDGTLLDTSPGIVHCFNVVADHLGRPRLTTAAARSLIGGPLLANLINAFSLDAATAAQAVEVYRQEYARSGVRLLHEYPGTRDLLGRLRRAGYATAVATLKRDDLAKTILREQGMAADFDLIAGVDARDTLGKDDLLRLVLSSLSVKAQRAVLVGDSDHDARGAAEVGVGFIGLTAPYGFSPASYNCPGLRLDGTAGSAQDIFALITGDSSAT